MLSIYVALANSASELVGRVRARFSRENGATAVEYGLLVALIAAVIVTVVMVLGQQVKSGFQTTCDAIKTGIGGGTAAAC